MQEVLQKYRHPVNKFFLNQSTEKKVLHKCIQSTGYMHSPWPELSFTALKINSQFSQY